MLDVVIPVLGEILATTSKTGGVLSTEPTALEVATSPNESVMVATQVRLSEGALLLDVNANVEPVPILLPVESNHS